MSENIGKVDRDELERLRLQSKAVSASSRIRDINKAPEVGKDADKPELKRSRSRSRLSRGSSSGLAAVSWTRWFGSKVSWQP